MALGSPVIARERSGEAIQTSAPIAFVWIASLPLARTIGRQAPPKQQAAVDLGDIAGDGFWHCQILARASSLTSQ
jgi:hypothetical protein